MNGHLVFGETKTHQQRNVVFLVPSPMRFLATPKPMARQTLINYLHVAVGSSLSDIIHDCHITIRKLDQCPGLLSTMETNIAATESFHPKESLHQYMSQQVEAAILPGSNTRKPGPDR